MGPGEARNGRVSLFLGAEWCGCDYFATVPIGRRIPGTGRNRPLSESDKVDPEQEGSDDDDGGGEAVAAAKPIISLKPANPAILAPLGKVNLMAGERELTFS